MEGYQFYIENNTRTWTLGQLARCTEEGRGGEDPCSEERELREGEREGERVQAGV